jgi:hypothetical protein
MTSVGRYIDANENTIYCDLCDISSDNTIYHHIGKYHDVSAED